MKAIRITFWIQFALGAMAILLVLLGANQLSIIFGLLNMLVLVPNLIMVIHRVIRQPSYEVFVYLVIDIALLFLYNEYAAAHFFSQNIMKSS